ncbi:MAPEG family protein [Rhodovulum sp. YNF3179]|uniref:MAPEG family protein n=1 Tax=Rhodovulum sp. YNF3179 TaxID=3425127 RepID=UPI003D33E60E
MSAELTVLALAGLLQAVQYVLMAVPANLELGPGYTAGPRDDAPPRVLSARTGRLVRALDNHFEALILFTLAVVVVTLSNQATALTAALAWLYLAARVLYIPAYAFGWRPWRSVIWLVGFGSSILIIIAALRGALGGA